MSIEQARSWTGSSPEVTKRLCATIVFFIGIICIIGGYLLGRMSKSELRRTNDIISYNLTLMAENLYKKAKRISPKVIHHNDSRKVTARLLETFHCTQSDCGAIDGLNLAVFIRNCINNEVMKLIKSVHNATMYLDALR